MTTTKSTISTSAIRATRQRLAHLIMINVFRTVEYKGDVHTNLSSVSRMTARPHLISILFLPASQSVVVCKGITITATPATQNPGNTNFQKRNKNWFPSTEAWQCTDQIRRRRVALPGSWVRTWYLALVLLDDTQIQVQVGSRGLPR